MKPKDICNPTTIYQNGKKVRWKTGKWFSGKKDGLTGAPVTKSKLTHSAQYQKKAQKLKTEEILETRDWAGAKNEGIGWKSV